MVMVFQRRTCLARLGDCPFPIFDGLAIFHESYFWRLFQGSVRETDDRHEARDRQAHEAWVRQINFQPRPDEEIRALATKWAHYAHPRARTLFSTEASLETILAEVARGIAKNDDPICSLEVRCAYWHGGTSEVDGLRAEATIRVLKPMWQPQHEPEPLENSCGVVKVQRMHDPDDNIQWDVTYVNRLLCFIFATDSCFERSMRLPKKPFRMSCGDQLCVHLGHISMSCD